MNQPGRGSGPAPGRGNQPGRSSGSEGDRHQREDGAAGLKVAPVGGDLPEIGQLVRAIDAAQAARQGIREHARPDQLRLAHHHRVGVLEGLAGSHRRMNAAQDDQLAGIAVAIGDLVRAPRLDCHGGDAHQVELSVLESDGVAEMFLKDGDVVVGRRDRGQWLERRTLDLSSFETYTRIRIDKSDSRAEAVAYPVSGRRPVRFRLAHRQSSATRSTDEIGTLAPAERPRLILRGSWLIPTARR